MEYDVFISYSSIDGDVAQKVWTYLRMRGLNPWIAPQCIPAGEPYARAIINGITKCKLMVVILSKASNSSDDVLNEIDQAHREKKVVLPFIIDNTEMSGEMKYYLSRKQWIKAYPDVTTAHCEKLFKAISVYLPPSDEEKPQDGETLSEPQTTPQEMKPGAKPEPRTVKSDIAQFMMEKFHGLGLVSTSRYDWRKPRKSRVFSIIFFAISLVPLSLFMGFFLNMLTVTWEGPYENDVQIVWHYVPENSDEKPYCYVSKLDYHEWPSQIGMKVNVGAHLYISGNGEYHSHNIDNIMGRTEDEVRIRVQEAIDREKKHILNYIREYCARYCAIFFALALPCLAFGFLFLAPYPRKGSPKLSSLADYIQKYRYKRKTRLGKKPQFVFFVKDSLFGVMNVADYKVQIPALYEKISWIEEGKLIRVTKDGHDFVIDINGVRLQ